MFQLVVSISFVSVDGNLSTAAYLAAVTQLDNMCQAIYSYFVLICVSISMQLVYCIDGGSNGRAASGASV